MMHQSDINYLYAFLNPYYSVIAKEYGSTTSVEFQRLVRMVAEGHESVILDGSCRELTGCEPLVEILNRANFMVHDHERFEANRPVELKHIFASLSYVISS